MWRRKASIPACPQLEKREGEGERREEGWVVNCFNIFFIWCHVLSYIYKGNQVWSVFAACRGYFSWRLGSMERSPLRFISDIGSKYHHSKACHTVSIKMSLCQKPRGWSYLWFLFSVIWIRYCCGSSGLCKMWPMNRDDFLKVHVNSLATSETIIFQTDLRFRCFLFYYKTTLEFPLKRGIYL